MTNQQRQPRGRDSLRFPLFVAVVYAVTAGLWILLSDRAAAWLFPPSEVVTRIQTFKGLGFVAVTTTVLFVLLYHQSHQRAVIEVGLRESEEKFAAAFRASPIGITITTMAGAVVEANQAFCELMGYTREELVGRTSISLGIYTAEARQEWTDTLKRQGGRITNAESTFTNRHGNTRAILYSTETISFHGEPHFLTTCQEITERTRAEEALRESERKYHTLFSEMFLGCAVHEAVYDDDGKIADYVTLEVNNAFEKLLGAPRESVVGKRASEILPEEELAGWLEIFEPVATTGKSTHYERYSDLNQRYFEGTAYCPEKGKFAVTFSDVTESRKAEDALRESEEKFAAAFRASPIGLAITTMAGAVVEANQALCDLLGYTREELVGKTSVELGLYTAEARQKLAESFNRGSGSVTNVERVIPDRHGNPHTILYSAETISFHGEPHFLTTCLDITERKRGEEALRLNNFILERTSEAVYWINVATILDVNDAACRMLGYTREEFQGMSVTVIDSTLSEAETEGVWDRLIEEGSLLFETHHKTKDGRILSVEITMNYIEFEGKKLNCCFVRDVTDRKQAEEALRESEEKHRLLLESAGVGIGYYDLKGNILLLNNKAAEYLHGEPDDFIGRSAVDVFGKEVGQSILTRIADTLKTESSLVFEDQIDLPAGNMYFLSTYHAIYDLSGECIGIQIISNNISDRRQTEEALRQNEANLQALTENTDGSIWSVDTDYRLIIGNSIFHRDVINALGHDIAIGENVLPPDVPPTARDEWRTNYDRAQRGEMFSVETQLYFVEPERWAEYRFSPIRDSDGTITGVTIFGRDITDRKQAEEALRDSEIRYRRLFEAAKDGILILDAKTGQIVDVNPFLVNLLDYSREEFLGKRIWEIGSMANIAASKTAFAKLRNHRYIRYEDLPLETKGGKRIAVEFVSNTYEVDHKSVIQCNIRDITDRRQAELALREQHILAEALANTAAVVNNTLDLSEVLGQVLDNVGQVVPHEAAEVWLIEDDIVRVVGNQGHVGRISVENLLAARLPVDEIANLRTARETGQPVLIAETREYEGWIKLDPAGWVRSVVTVPIQVDDDTLGFLNLLSDTPNHYTPAQAGHLQAFANQVATAIQNARLYQELERHSESLQRAVEERTAELLQTKERVETIINYSPDPILLLKPSGAIETANPAFQRVFGYQIDEIHRQQPFNLIAPDHAEAIQIAMARAIENRRVERRELVARRKDDTTFDAELALAPIVEEGGTPLGVVCTVRDISPLKEVARMKDAFVSNVSHELRTPITGLKLNHKLIEMDPGKIDIYLERQGREIDRLNVLIEDLLRLSRLDQERIKLDLKPLDLNALVAQYVNDRTPLAESRELTLSLEAHADLPTVQADVGLIGQTLSVLLTNAFNYTPAGGQVMVTTQSAEFDGRRWAGFSVGDTGPGISPADFPHLFERFYRGRAGYESGVPGTGLGLAIAREIVERHRGRIEVANQANANAGAVFTVWLSVAEG